jgi:hypothetical protein
MDIMPEESASGVSCAATERVTCPACGRDFTTQFWLITVPLSRKEGRP